eukprot:TRINITY_DN2606_c0_g1_i3.p1 TRINITY_DN2606_c0_g1~~TRINITY_DN2606_c0_g1_i3.p1  ORF type:complete len:382 (+),score=75.56 TRINITY_DN2606_c0_g1_i3:655-1800(+)
MRMKGTKRKQRPTTTTTTTTPTASSATTTATAAAGAGGPPTHTPETRSPPTPANNTAPPSTPDQRPASPNPHTHPHDPPHLTDKEKLLRNKYILLHDKKKAAREKVKPQESPKVRPDAVKQLLTTATVGTAEKEAGFKRPAKLQRRLDERQDNSSHEAEEASHTPKRRRVDPLSKQEDRLEGDTEHTYPIVESYQPFPGRYPSPAQSPFGELGEGDYYYPTTVFVGSLSDTTDERELQMHFARFGPIESIRHIAVKNFAFIKYVTREAASAAIAGMNGELMGQQTIRVSKAKVPGARGPPWARRRSYPFPHQPSPRDEGPHDREDDTYRGPIRRMSLENEPPSMAPSPVMLAHSHPATPAMDAGMPPSTPMDRTMLQYDDL